MGDSLVHCNGDLIGDVQVVMLEIFKFQKYLLNVCWLFRFFVSERVYFFFGDYDTYTISQNK